MSIILVDVNGLKLINDAFGHQKGDDLLVKTSDLLQDVFKEGLISRIGGDEFAIIHLDKTETELGKLIKSMHKQASRLEIQGVSLSLSQGYAIRDNDNRTLNDLFTEAEDWMYREKLNQVPSNRSAIIDTIIATINEKDSYSEIHSQRVSLISTRIAELLGVNDSMVGEVRTAGLLHDIGKIIVPTHILRKDGKLTSDEYEEIKKHSEIGYRILNSVSSMRNIADYVFAHHEKVDGTGYPRGLKEHEIPLPSRIISIADALDAMTNDRTYREKLSKEETLAEIKKYRGTQFCIDAADVVITHFDEIYELATKELE